MQQSGNIADNSLFNQGFGQNNHDEFEDHL